MDYAEALTWIEKQEGGSEILKAIKSRVDGILDEKRRATKERDTSSTRISSLESLVEHLTKLAGGEGDNPEARIKSATDKISALSLEVETIRKTLADTETANLAAESSKSELEQRLAKQERLILVTDAAIASGANRNVLRMLVGDSDVSFEITSGDNSKQVLIVKGDEKKPISEYAAAYWADFVPSLFPSTTDSKPPAANLPSGTPNGKPEQKDLVKNYIASAGFGLNK